MLCVLALAVASACSAVGDYAADRGHDLEDLLRGHVMAGRGIGAKLELTHFIQLGYDNYYADAAGWTGRQWATWREEIFGWGLLVGQHRETLEGIDRISGSYGWAGGDARFDGADSGGPLDWLTLRARLFMFFGVDLEVRVGEVLDFAVGLFGFDPSGDDGAVHAGPTKNSYEQPEATPQVEESLPDPGDGVG